MWTPRNQVSHKLGMQHVIPVDRDIKDYMSTLAAQRRDGSYVAYCAARGGFYLFTDNGDLAMVAKLYAQSGC